MNTVRKDIDVRYKDHVLDQILLRFRIVNIVDIVFIMGFTLVDRVAYHPFTGLFLEIRAVTCLVIFILFLISFLPQARSRTIWLVDAMGMVITAGIALMYYLTDGSSSRYYEGLNLVIINMGVINLFYVRHNIASFLLWLGINDAAMIFSKAHFNPVNFCYANAFMFTTGFLIVLMTKFYKDQHYQAYVNQEQLKLNMEVLRKVKEEIEEADRELKIQTEELARSNKELEQFAYVASHDLQEPLRMVASFCQKLEKNYKDKLDAAANEYIHFAVDGSRRMQAVIDGLLKYARVGKKGVEITPVDLNKTLKTILHDLDGVIRHNEASVRVGPLPVVMANDVHMTQLFQNFLTNALKFKDPQRKSIIEVAATRKPEGWEFKISDNGIGIDQQHFSNLFVLFQRFHERGVYPGSGIGLASCKKIIENYHGNVKVESKVGEGTTFFFTLKVKEVPA